MPGEIAQLDDELSRAFDGDCWHGPPLARVLDGVTAAAAARKYPPLAHSVWEMVHHLTVWAEVVRLRVVEGLPHLEPRRGDFPPVGDASESAWEAAMLDLADQAEQLREVVTGLSAARLDEPVPGKSYSVSVMLHGTAQHFAYHAGQIALLKKLLAAG